MAGEMGSITAVLTADNAQFDKAMQRSGENAAASANLRAKAAKLAAEAEAFAARFAGDTVDGQARRMVDARRVEVMASADMRKAQQLNKAGYLGEEASADLLAKALQRLTAAKAASAAASAVESNAITHATVSQMQATSAAVRSLEGNPGIRATERFLTTIPGVGQALQAAFPLIGGLAFGAMIVEMGEKIAEFVKKVNQMPDAVRRGFESMHLSAAASSDQLRLTNDELQNSINKLEGRSENNLALELDEARIKADDLAKSLEEDAKKVKELLAANSISELGALMGKGSTGSVAGSVNSFQQKISDIGYARSELFRSGDTQGVAAKDRELAQVRKQIMDWTQDQLKVRTKSPEIMNLAKGAPEGGGGIVYQGKTYQDMAGDQTANKNVLQGFRTTIQDSQDREQLKDNNGALVAAQKKAEAIKAAQELAKQQASAARAAQKKADEEAVKALEDAHRSWQAIADRSKGDEVAYWADRVASLKRGSAAYTDAIKKFQQDTIALNRENNEAIANFTKEYLADFTKTGGSLTPEADKSNLKAQGQAEKDRVLSMKAQIDGNVANADAIARASVQMQLATGNMTKLDAARVMATLHQQEYNDALDKLRDRENYIRDKIPSGEKPKPEQEAQLNDIETERRALTTRNTIQVQQDQLATGGRDSSAVVGATDALRDFVNATRDSAAAMRNFVDKALSGINSQLVTAISTRGSQRAGFANFGAGLGRDVAGSALKKGEGSILGMLGFGDKTKKPSGTRGDPLYVAYADAIAAAAGSGASNAKAFQGALTIAQDAASDDKAAGGISTIPSVLTKLIPLIGDIPMFASGGAIDPNQWAIVGEEGPELFHSGGGGTIVPNHQISMGGGGGDTHYHVDARGATDPAATAAMVQRAIKAAAPHIAAAGVKATAEQRMRGPSSKR